MTRATPFATDPRAPPDATLLCRHREHGGRRANVEGGTLGEDPAQTSRVVPTVSGKDESSTAARPMRRAATPFGTTSRKKQQHLHLPVIEPVAQESTFMQSSLICQHDSRQSLSRQPAPKGFTMRESSLPYDARLPTTQNLSRQPAAHKDFMPCLRHKETRRTQDRWPCSRHTPFSVSAVRDLLAAADRLGDWPEGLDVLD